MTGATMTQTIRRSILVATAVATGLSLPGCTLSYRHGDLDKSALTGSPTPEAGDPHVRLDFERASRRFETRCASAFAASGLFAARSKGEGEANVVVRVRADQHWEPSGIGSLVSVFSLFTVPAKRGSRHHALEAEIEIPAFEEPQRVSFEETIDRWVGFALLPGSFVRAETPETHRRLCHALAVRVRRVYDSFLSEAWSRTTTAGDIETYAQFLAAYPDSDYAGPAEETMRKLRFEAAVREDTSLAYDAFLASYPEGSDADTIRARLEVARERERLAEALAEALIRMAPEWGITMALTGSRFQARELVKRESPTRRRDLEEVKSLLRAGADPNAVRIEGYEPAGREPLPGGRLVRVTTGNKGHVVHATEGGVSLLEYCEENDLREAATLLRRHGAR